MDKVRNKAYKYFQMYIRLLRADNDGYLTLACSGKRVLRTKCNAGHIYSKHYYPHIAFNIENCYPISAMTNKIQGASI